MEGSVTFDRFLPQMQQHAASFVRKDGRWYSAFPIAAPLLLTPLYAPAALAARAARWNTDQIVLLAGVLEKLAASLIAALSVALFYVLAGRLTSRTRALVATLAYALATETWVISSQALWQHGVGELAVIAGLYLLVRGWGRNEQRIWLVLAGACGAIAAAARPTNTLFVAAVCIALAMEKRRVRNVALFTLAPIVVGAAVLAYNLRVFGRVTGGYTADFSGPFWQGFTGLLASPGRGLLIYTPVAVFSALGAWTWLRKRELAPTPVYLICILFSVSQVLLVSKWRIWWGGHCYGPRLLADIMPCLMLLLLPAMEWFACRTVWRTAFAVTLGWSVFVQALGAFCYPASRWDELPVAVGDRPARLWDWRDSPITRSLVTGPRFGPDATFYDRLRNASRPPAVPAQPSNE